MQAATKAAAHLQALDYRQPSEVCTLVGAVTLTWLAYRVFSSALKVLLFLFQLEPPKVVVPITEDEAADVLEGCDRFDTDALKGEVRAACCVLQRVHAHRNTHACPMCPVCSACPMQPVS